MKFINLTPHEVVIANPFMNLAFKPSGSVARVEMTYEKKLIEVEVAEGMNLSIPCQTTPRAKVLNLPEPKEGILYIVSSYVAQIVKREDLVSPLTDNSAERDENGNILSVKSFQTYTDKQELTFENKDLVTVLGA